MNRTLCLDVSAVTDLAGINLLPELQKLGYKLKTTSLAWERAGLATSGNTLTPNGYPVIEPITDEMWEELLKMKSAHKGMTLADLSILLYAYDNLTPLISPDAAIRMQASKMEIAVVGYESLLDELVEAGILQQMKARQYHLQLIENNPFYEPENGGQTMAADVLMAYKKSKSKILP